MKSVIPGHLPYDNSDLIDAAFMHRKVAAITSSDARDQRRPLWARRRLPLIRQSFLRKVIASDLVLRALENVAAIYYRLLHAL